MLATRTEQDQPTTNTAPAAERALPAPAAAQHHVLVVDDDDAFARTVADALGDRDIEAVAISDPQRGARASRGGRSRSRPPWST